MSDIYKKHEGIKTTVGSYLKGVIFHKIHIAKRLYKSILDVELGDTSWLEDAVSIRHDCVHRAGYTKENNEVNVTVNSMNELIEKCIVFGEDVNSQVLFHSL